jgi:hypothetical protein
MATTTNYSWSTPDDTALVKDGAAAIRTLGSSVDTTVKNLNPETTLGDISYRSSTANVKTRLALGTANQQLRVNSGATAPEWFTPAASGGMSLISTTSLTGASVTLSSIPQTYKNLQLIIRNHDPAQDGYSLYIRMNADSGSNRHYSSYVMGVASGAFNSTEWTTAGLDNGTSTFLLKSDIYDYTNTTTWKIADTYFVGNNETTPANANLTRVHHVYNQTSAISSIQIFTDSTSFTGEALLYGVS